MLGCRTVRTHRLALGRATGTHPMSLPYRTGLPVHGRAFVTDGAHGLGPNSEFPTERRLMVPVRTLDALTDARTGGPLPERVDFVKADVEGAEPLVVEGARETLLRNRPALLLEIEARHLAKYGERPDRLVARLSALGYAMYVWRRDHWHPVDHVTGAHRNYLFTTTPPEA
ncbi:FkbM family methyltransferase [Kitasatospora sp. NPDC056327]|uniref:FkbM family methyltransferase n=1 Tax=Kitasatospora sp. NPDC056327 TaxID=3345785 RepID=UPI0035D71437